MKKRTHIPMLRAAFALALGIAVSAAPSALGQMTADEMRIMKEENAALKAQIQQLQQKLGIFPAETAPAPAVAETPAPPPTRSTAEPLAPQELATARTVERDGEQVVVMSPFEVSSDKDYGYRLTNSTTATRIGVPIQQTPLAVSVLGEEFLKDTRTEDLQDILRFIPTASGDNQAGILQPQTGFTQSGRQSIRGFPVDAIMRNSVKRYTLFTNENVERVEVIQGPASVFFGQAFPGGVINYITKKPKFADIPTTLQWQMGITRNGNKFNLDENRVLNDNMAMRLVTYYEQMGGHRDYEYRNGYLVMPSFTLRAADKLTITAEVEFSGRTQNLDNQTWIWPAQWFADYANPPAALIAASGVADADAYRARIAGGSGSNGSWIADVRNAANDQYIPLYTAFRGGPVAERLAPEDFNTFGSGSFSEQDVRNIEVTVDASPMEWLDLRFVYNNSDAYYYENRAQARPLADGITYDTLVGWTYRHYRQISENYVLDTVWKFDLGDNFRNKFLLGGVYRENRNEYGGTPTTFGNTLPGYNFPYDGLPDPGGTSEYVGVGDFRQVPGSNYFSTTQLQALRDRNGNVMSATDVFTKYDPSIHAYPDLRAIGMPPRALIDRYEPKQENWYASYQGDWFKNKLHWMLGYRDEKDYNGKQVLSANPPWFGYEPYILENIPPEQWAAFATNEAYARSTRLDESGNSWMFGAAFDVSERMTVYGSISQSYKPNGGNQAIYGETEVLARAEQIGLNPQQELARIKAEGADIEVPNEQGKNYEVGVKLSTDDSKLTGTVSLFNLQRKNQRKEDLARQTGDPLNYNATGSYSRIVRWFSTDATWETQGLSFDMVWTPTRNYQAIFNGGWMWKADVVDDPQILPSNINWRATFEGRIPNAPKYTFSLWNKYSFTEGPAQGLTLAGGARYRSEMVISNTRDWDPNYGGLSSGDYVVFDFMASYGLRVMETDLNFSLFVNNLFDTEYSEGGWNLAPPRDISLTTTLRF